MLTKLKAIMTEKEQLSNIEKQLRCKLEAEASKAASPRAARAAAARSAVLQHQLNGCARSAQARAVHQPVPLGSPAAAPADSRPCRHSSSTAAALLAAGADPALVVEYVRAHKQQQQQHQACAAAVVAAAAAAGSNSRAALAGHKHARKQGLCPGAMAKLRQLMALQQQQIQVQQVGGGVLCCAVLVKALCWGCRGVSGCRVMCIHKLLARPRRLVVHGCAIMSWIEAEPWDVPPLKSHTGVVAYQTPVCLLVAAACLLLQELLALL
jgi:hypothetical protein